ncbi:MAG: hypothetical protein JSR09_01335 [Bacteroidetes bacterium]|nr:hypothetical protein [Bacteroidota bacterium]MBS1648322.1 hypothetical protein [Bacteroidota bacterium]
MQKCSNIFFYIIAILFFTSCSLTRTAHYQFNQKYAAQKLKEDVVLLKKILEANHPSLYWYTTKDSLDTRFNTIINSITDSLTETEFRNKVAYAISAIHCGHTSVRFSKQYNKHISNHIYPTFPLSIKVWQDSMVVLRNLVKKNTVLKPGTIITSINGKTIETITAAMFPYISTDGYATNYKYQVISGNFGGWYKNIFGLEKEYIINYIDSLGNKKQTIISNFTLKKDTVTKKDTTISLNPENEKKIKISSLQQKRSLSIDTSFSTAYMRLTTFGKAKLKKFFRQSFRIIHKKNLKNLIIDLRENGGGNVDNFVKLTQYTKDTAFNIADTVEAITRKLAYKKYIHPGIIQWLNLNFFTAKKVDGNYHQQRTEEHYFKLKTKHHFNGHIYIITGGYTYSAATMFAGIMKGQHNVTLVGEETGGGYYGNTAMQIPDIILPTSHLRVRLPLFKVILNTNRIKNGSGVLPDIYISPSSTAIKKNIDIKLDTIKNLIRTKL